MASLPAAAAVDLFISYAHSDDLLRAALEKHLTPLVREHLIRNWHDRKIGAGSDWNNAIDEHLGTAEIILLLISADFLASDYCFDIEMATALKRHDSGRAIVIPVILRPVDWHSSPFGKLQALPGDGKPITEYLNQDAALAEVARGIRTTVKDFVQHRAGQAGDPGMAMIPDSLTISYRPLLDADEIVRTGEKLVEVLSAPRLRAAVQPFVEKYSDLLSAVVDITSEDLPHSTVMDFFPSGACEPAWVALLRCGRIHITTDGEAHARVFLIGDDPKTAYASNYSVVRHCLGALARLAKRDLRVDVFAYRNDYKTSELTLKKSPFSFTAVSFGRETTKRSIGLQDLQDFFAQGAELQGGTLRYNDNLILTGKEGTKQTLAGKPVELSDLAVAFRAVFHAGDNRAFVSLDPSRDPTKVNVNFGGLLEHTRIGHVLLDADKRFKTITSGIDPEWLSDARPHTRKHVADFLTGQERRLLGANSQFRNREGDDKKWIGTRFWYYPDTISLHADAEYESAAVVNVRFAADAERRREDFDSAEDYEKRKREMLLPSNRECIEDLNRRYDQYAKAFPELSELDTAARLLAICEWLSKRKPSWLDLDELLTVELPTCNTEADRTRLIGATFLSRRSGAAPNQEEVVEESWVEYLTPILDRTVEEVFESPSRFAECFQSQRSDKHTQSREAPKRTAPELFIAFKHSRVRDVIRTQDDLQSLATFAADAIAGPISRGVADLKAEVGRYESALQELAAKIEKLQAQMLHVEARMQTLEAKMESSGGINDGAPDQLLLDIRNKEIASEGQELDRKHERLEHEHKARCAEYNRLLDDYARLQQGKPAVINLRTLEISGGVSADSANFSFQVDSSSEELIAFKQFQRQSGFTYTKMPNGQRWVRTKRTDTSESSRQPEITGLPERASQIKRSKVIAASSAGQWRIEVTRNGRLVRAHRYDTEKRELRVTECPANREEQTIFASWETNDRIVFRRVPSGN